MFNVPSKVQYRNSSDVKFLNLRSGRGSNPKLENGILKCYQLHYHCKNGSCYLFNMSEERIEHSRLPLQGRALPLSYADLGLGPKRIALLFLPCKGNVLLLNYRPTSIYLCSYIYFITGTSLLILPIKLCFN